MSVPDRELWSGRLDAQDGHRGRRWHQLVRALEPGLSPGVAVLGFACDAGVARNAGRTGAAEGPAAIRRMLAGLAWHGSDAVPLIDAGDVRCEGDALEAAQQALGARVAELLRAGHLPLLLGGGHEIAWGSFQGIAAAHGGELAGYGALNFDAHFDLRRSPSPGIGTSGTPFFQIAAALGERGLPLRYLCIGVSEAANTLALYDAARQCGARWIADELLDGTALQGVLETVDRFLDEVRMLQLSICLDALPESVAPGVSAPAARGIPPAVFFRLLAHVLGRSAGPAGERSLVLAEIAECNPRFDRDQQTARLAARIAYECARRTLRGS